MGASTVPFVFGFNSLVFISISDLTLCLVICMSPILLGGNTLCLALSDSISFLKCSNKFFLFSGLVISMKSITMIPPMSLKRNCLAISVAAIKLTSKAVSS